MNITTLFKNKNKLGVMSALILGVGAGGIIATSPITLAAGTSRYVATTGTDTGDCSNVGTPCETIQYAIDQAASGDAVSVAAGTYSEIVEVTESITLQGARAGVDGRSRSGGETILQTPGGQARTLEIKANDVTVDGFTINGSTGTNALGINLVGPTTANATVVNNIIKNNKVGVDAIYTDISGILVSKNLFDSNNVSGASDGVYLANVSGSDIEVSDNTFKNTDDGTVNASAAINIYGEQATPLTNVRILRNSSTNDGTMLFIMSAHDVTVANNTATSQQRAVISIDRGVDTMTIQDNTFSSSAYGIRFRGAFLPGAPVTTNVTVTGNTISGMSVAGVLVEADSIGNGINLVSNVITGNAIGLDNQSTATVTANGNNWGCVAGPGTAGCDSVDGNVTLSSWIGQVVPGVPNTGSQPSAAPLAALGTVSGLLLLGGIYTLRKLRS
jgi:hypothetical protein